MLAASALVSAQAPQGAAGDVPVDAMQLVSRAQNYPDTFVQNVDARRDRMEQMRQALTRHLKR